METKTEKLKKKGERLLKQLKALADQYEKAKEKNPDLYIPSLERRKADDEPAQN
ncbi:hypothetical protein FACS189485_02040 [Spirochaetia bacterium]|nr:hypothetical protein FACS189485_02040 [Spirochaetia bacterium]